MTIGLGLRCIYPNLPCPDRLFWWPGGRGTGQSQVIQWSVRTGPGQWSPSSWSTAPSCSSLTHTGRASCQKVCAERSTAASISGRKWTQTTTRWVVSHCGLVHLSCAEDVAWRHWQSFIPSTYATSYDILVEFQYYIIFCASLYPTN